MREPLLRKVATAILSLDLTESQLRELEELLMNRGRVQNLLSACRAARRLLSLESSTDRMGVMDRELDEVFELEGLVKAVRARPDLTIRQLAEIAQLSCGRKLAPGSADKVEYVRKLARQLRAEELHRLAQAVKGLPRSTEGKEIDEWFQQMSKRIRGGR